VGMCLIIPPSKFYVLEIKNIDFDIITPDFYDTLHTSPHVISRKSSNVGYRLLSLEIHASVE
jgi:hypothetical protein